MPHEDPGFGSYETEYGMVSTATPEVYRTARYIGPSRSAALSPDEKRNRQEQIAQDEMQRASDKAEIINTKYSQYITPSGYFEVRDSQGNINKRLTEIYYSRYKAEFGIYEGHLAKAGEIASKYNLQSIATPGDFMGDAARKIPIRDTSKFGKQVAKQERREYATESFIQDKLSGNIPFVPFGKQVGMGTRWLVGGLATAGITTLGAGERILTGGFVRQVKERPVETIFAGFDLFLMGRGTTIKSGLKSLSRKGVGQVGKITRKADAGITTIKGLTITPLTEGGKLFRRTFAKDPFITPFTAKGISKMATITKITKTAKKTYKQKGFPTITIGGEETGRISMRGRIGFGVSKTLGEPRWIDMAKSDILREGRMYKELGLEVIGKKPKIRADLRGPIPTERYAKGISLSEFPGMFKGKIAKGIEGVQQKGLELGSDIYSLSKERLISPKGLFKTDIKDVAEIVKKKKSGIKTDIITFQKGSDIIALGKIKVPTRFGRITEIPYGAFFRKGEEISKKGSEDVIKMIAGRSKSESRNVLKELGYMDAKVEPSIKAAIKSSAKGSIPTKLTKSPTSLPPSPLRTTSQDYTEYGLLGQGGLPPQMKQTLLGVGVTGKIKSRIALMPMQKLKTKTTQKSKTRHLFKTPTTQMFKLKTPQKAKLATRASLGLTTKSRTKLKQTTKAKSPLIPIITSMPKLKPPFPIFKLPGLPKKTKKKKKGRRDFTRRKAAYRPSLIGLDLPKGKKVKTTGLFTGLEIRRRK